MRRTTCAERGAREFFLPFGLSGLVSVTQTTLLTEVRVVRSG